MLNKLTGWLMFSQLTYIILCIVLVLINLATGGGLANLLVPIRNAVGLSNHYFSLSNYVSHPIACTTPINIILALVFFWTLLRRNTGIEFSKGFFNVINALYVVCCSWIFMIVLITMLDRNAF